MKSTMTGTKARNGSAGFTLLKFDHFGRDVTSRVTECVIDSEPEIRRMIWVAGNDLPRLCANRAAHHRNRLVRTVEEDIEKFDLSV